MRDTKPSAITLEGSEPQSDKWPKVERPTLKEERMVYPGAGSELFHEKKRGG